jgi:soluble lytic murein transglycosylase
LALPPFSAKKAGFSPISSNHCRKQKLRLVFSWRGRLGGGGDLVRRGSIFVLSAAAFIMTAGPLAYAATVQQLQQQESRAQQQLAAEEQKYAQTQAAINQTVAQMDQLNQDLSSAKAQIGSTGAQIQSTNHDIQITQNLLATTQARLAQTEKQLAVTTVAYQRTTALVARTKRQLVHQGHLLSAQLQLIEERGSIGYIDVILGARSFSEFISRAQILGQVAAAAAHEVQVIKNEEAHYTLEQDNLKRESVFLSESKNSIARRQSLLSGEQALLTRERQRAIVLQTDAEQEASTVSVGLNERQRLVEQLQGQRSQLASGMASLKSRIASLVSQIQALVSQFNDGSLTRQALYNALVPLVSPIAEQWGVPVPLVIAVITVESGGNSSAVSSAGAIGLMQVEPGTAQDIASAVGLSASTVMQELYNPSDNVELGTYYLHYTLGLFGSNTPLAVAAYNAGPGAVQQYGGIPPYPQTQHYVADVMSLYQLYSTY